MIALVCLCVFRSGLIWYRERGNLWVDIALLLNENMREREGRVGFQIRELKIHTLTRKGEPFVGFM